MNIVSLITARGGSKGLPYKNIKHINGKPLVSYSITESLKSNVDETWVSTEDNKIKEVSLLYGAQVIDRPKHLADDIIMPDDSIIHFAECVDFDYVVFIQPTSPLIKSKYIDIGIEMIKSGEYDSVFTVTKEHWLPRWNKDVETVDWDIYKRPRRQDKPELYVENGMFYITKKENLLSSKLRYSGKMGMVVIPVIDSFQVDNEEDLELIRKII